MNKFKAPCAASILIPAVVFTMAGPVATDGHARMHQGQNVQMSQAGHSGVQLDAHLATGFLNGEAHELVYWPQENNHKASELIWRLEDVFMIGAGASIKPVHWLKLNLEGWSMADGDGSMDDYDWLEPGRDWTDWSHHEDVTISKGTTFDFNAQFPVVSSQGFQLNTYIGFRHENWEWEARGGSYIYSVNGFRDEVGSFPAGELGITYEQTVSTPYAGVGATLDMNALRIETKVIGSTLVSGEAVDHHHMRSLVTYDDFSGGDMISFDITAEFQINQNFSFGGGFVYTNYDTVTGDSEWHFGDGTVLVSPDGAGMDLQHSLFLLTLKYLF